MASEKAGRRVEMAELMEDRLVQPGASSWKLDRMQNDFHGAGFYAETRSEGHGRKDNC